VESIDAASKSMTVDGDKVDGWMEAMSMKYQVDNADVFKTIKEGDAIEQLSMTATTSCIKSMW
jgi:Cu/Ag efflux protein CusF